MNRLKQWRAGAKTRRRHQADRADQAAAASLKMSPNMLVVSITSNCVGRSVNCIAALSTYMCSSFT